MPLHEQRQSHLKKQPLALENEQDQKHSSPQADAPDLQHAVGEIAQASPGEILRLQQIAGNQAVNGLIQAHLQVTSAPQTSQTIQRGKGAKGHAGDEDLAARLAPDPRIAKLASDYKAGKLTHHQLAHAMIKMGDPPDVVSDFIARLKESERANSKESLKASMGFEPADKPKGHAGAGGAAGGGGAADAAGAAAAAAPYMSAEALNQAMSAASMAEDVDE
jgi:hypothetical protein